MIVETPAKMVAVGDKLFQSGEWFTVRSVETTSEGTSVFITTDLGIVRYGATTIQHVMRADRIQDGPSDVAKRVTVTVLERAVAVIESLGYTTPGRKRGRADAVAVLMELIQATEKGN